MSDALVHAQQTEPTPLQITGFTTLDARLGRQAPVGRGVIVGHVEGGKDYAPDANHPQLKNVQFRLRSGPSEVSGHASATANIIYGSKGAAPGITQVRVFSATPWMGADYLGAGTGLPPGQGDVECRLFTHSWISHHKPRNRPIESGTLEILLRTDDVIDQRGVIMVAGVNNGADKIVPVLMASAYNVIAVGALEGNSSGGFTLEDGPGRCKPEIIAPHGLTSLGTPLVAAAVARLLETADLMEQSFASRPEVIKAVLLTGATKGAAWSAPEGKPLHPHLGAGMLNVDRSHRILSAGPSAPGRVRKAQGWDYASLAPAQVSAYRFELGAPLRSLAATLVWHRRIGGKSIRLENVDKPAWNATPRLANINLELLAIDEAGQGKVLASSTTTNDNVEHVFLRDLSAGTYVLRATRIDQLTEPWNVALAWDFQLTQPDETPTTQPIAISEPAPAPATAPEASGK